MDASMYSISMAESWAMMAGHDNCATNRNRWAVVSGTPERNISDKSAANVSYGMGI